MQNLAIFLKGNKNADHYRQQVSQRGILQKIDAINESFLGLSGVTENELPEIYEILNDIEISLTKNANDPSTRKALQNFTNGKLINKAKEKSEETPSPAGKLPEPDENSTTKKIFSEYQPVEPINKPEEKSEETTEIEKTETPEPEVEETTKSPVAEDTTAPEGKPEEKPENQSEPATEDTTAPEGKPEEKLEDQSEPATEPVESTEEHEEKQETKKGGRKKKDAE